MDELVSFIIGAAASPVEMAVRFFLFIMFLDAIFSTLNSLIYSSKL